MKFNETGLLKLAAQRIIVELNYMQYVVVLRSFFEN